MEDCVYTQAESITTICMHEWEDHHHILSLLLTIPRTEVIYTKITLR